eukprot:794827-Prorocentrum_minimum.AAC.1
MRGYILTTDQSDAGCADIFSRRAYRTQDARVYSHDGPIGLPPPTAPVGPVSYTHLTLPTILLV